jgi:hypothetical protein
VTAPRFGYRNLTRAKQIKCFQKLVVFHFRFLSRAALMARSRLNKCGNMKMCKCELASFCRTYETVKPFNVVPYRSEFGDQRGKIAVLNFDIAGNAIGYAKHRSRSHDAVIRVR